ncbi:hypothetical protein [Shewanella baltica]|uniref:hypothetical protein n=1 Tax=Shewanella baltica TaxID=62322 RepID=UPI00217EFDA0|nr:hypothetical protein [Shewanella baltica]MCS6207188.1 hypothetical protein [Shewanella baltica]
MSLNIDHKTQGMNLSPKFRIASQVCWFESTYQTTHTKNKGQQLMLAFIPLI